MSLYSISSIHVRCDGDCCVNNELDTEFDFENEVIDWETYHSWLEDNGWLLCGELAFCPQCRLELHE